MLNHLIRFQWSVIEELWRKRRNVFNCPHRITGNYRVVDVIKTDGLTRMFAGIDLHYPQCDVKGEPTAWCKPLGWSCIGRSKGKENIPVQRTNLAYTFFARLDVFVYRSVFLPVEVNSMGTTQHTPAMTDQEKLVFETDKERYQVSVRLCDDYSTLKSQYTMAVKRLKTLKNDYYVKQLLDEIMKRQSVAFSCKDLSIK